jgi:hypothetical protein
MKFRKTDYLIMFSGHDQSEWFPKAQIWQIASILAPHSGTCGNDPLETICHLKMGLGPYRRRPFDIASRPPVIMQQKV